MEEMLPMLPKGWVAMREDCIRKLEQRADQDFLTGLYNRGAFQGRAEKLLEQSKIGCVLVLLDLDDLRMVNNRSGHLEGDRALWRVSKGISVTFPNSLTGRVGGDEFAVLLTECNDKDEVASLMSDFFGYLARSSAEEASIAVTVSAGAARFPADALDYTALFAAADLALYRVKSLGKKSFLFYDSSMK